MKNLKKSLGLFAVLAIFLSTASNAQAAPLFRRPLNITPVITSYYDNKAGTGLEKYTCSASGTYEGHKGTDFSAVVGTRIYAAANGGLYYRYNSCNTYGNWGNTCGNGGYGNHVRIDHEGNLTDGVGWVTIYAHMKKDTAAGLMTALCGAYIGQTGSSGWSDGPHLHFEVKKFAYPDNDPFSGACSWPTSFWVNQNNGAPTTACQQ